MPWNEAPLVENAPTDAWMDAPLVDDAPKEGINPSQDYGGAGTSRVAPKAIDFIADFMPKQPDLPEAPPEVAQQALRAKSVADSLLYMNSIPSRLDWSSEASPEQRLNHINNLQAKRDALFVEGDKLRRGLPDAMIPEQSQMRLGEIANEDAALHSAMKRVSLEPTSAKDIARSGELRDQLAALNFQYPDPTKTPKEASEKIDALGKEYASLNPKHPFQAEIAQDATYEQEQSYKNLTNKWDKPSVVGTALSRFGGELANQLGGAIKSISPDNTSIGQIGESLLDVGANEDFYASLGEGSMHSIARGAGSFGALALGNPTSKGAAAVVALRAAAGAWGQVYSATGSREEANKAAAKTFPEMAAFMLGGGLAAKAGAAILGEGASALKRATVGFAGAQVSNMAAGSIIRALDGGDWRPTIETLTVDTLFAILHGAGEYKGASAEIRKKAEAELENRNQGQPASSQAGMTSEQRIKAEGDKINQLLSDPNLPPEDAAALRKLAADHGIELKSEPVATPTATKPAEPVAAPDAGKARVGEWGTDSEGPITSAQYGRTMDAYDAFAGVSPKVEKAIREGTATPDQLQSATEQPLLFDTPKQKRDAFVLRDALRQKIDEVEAGDYSDSQARNHARLTEMLGKVEKQIADNAKSADKPEPVVEPAPVAKDEPARDAVKVEQMTPEEYFDAELKRRSAVTLPPFKEAIKSNPKPSDPKIRATWAEKLLQKFASALSDKADIPADWLSNYPLYREDILSLGYLRQGDKYVYREGREARGVTPNIFKLSPQKYYETLSLPELKLLREQGDTSSERGFIEDIRQRDMDELTERTKSNALDIQSQAVKSAIENNRPVSVALADAIEMPMEASGYVKRGDLYVHEGKQAASPAKAEPAPAKPAEGDFALKQQAASRTRSRKLNIPPAPNDTFDIIDTILGDHGKIKSRNQARLQKLKAEGKNRFQKTQQGGEYDGWNDLPPRLKKLLIDESGGGTTPDVMADNVGMEGDSSGLREKLIKAWEARLDWQKEQKRIAREEKAAEPAMRKQEKREQDFKQASGPESSDPLAFPIEGKDLKPGDDVVVEGETLKVTDVDEEGGTVTPEGGDRFGTQRIDTGDTIYGDHIKGEGHAEKPAEPVVEKPAEPTAKKPAKPSDELLGDETPFNLTAESPAEKAAREAAAEADAKAKADEQAAKDKAEQDKLQGDMFSPQSISDEAPKTPVNPSVVSRVVASLRARFKGSADTRVIADGEQYPDAVKAKAKAMGVSLNRIGGVLHDGVVWLNAAALHSPERAAEVFFHEQAGHVGVDALLDGLSPKASSRLLDALNREFPEESQYVAKQYAPSEHLSETLARIMEKFGPKSDATAKDQSRWRRIVDFIRNILVKSGIKKWSRNDIEALLRRGIDKIRKGDGKEAPVDVSELDGSELLYAAQKEGVKLTQEEKALTVNRDADVTANVRDKIEAARDNTKLSIEDEKQVTPEQDRAYMDAVEKGDDKKAKRMADDAAYKAGYTVQTKHGTRGGFDVFDRKASPLQNSTFDLNRWGIWTTDDAPQIYGPKTLRLYGKMESPKRFQTFDEWFKNYISKAYPIFAPTEGIKDFLKDLREYMGKAQPGTAEYRKLLADFEGAEGYRKYLKSEGHDGVIIEGDHIDGKLQTVRIFLEPEQLKSAEPVTRDASGKVIPLSERFNPKSDDIRFSIEGDNEEKGTSNKEAIVNQERAARGLDPIEKEGKITNTRALAVGQSELAAHPGRANEIIAELRYGNGMEREISLEKGAVLLAHRRNLTTDYYKALDRMGDSDLSPSARAAASIEAHGFEKALGELDQAAQDARSTWGRFGQFWKQQLKADFTFEALKRKLKAEKRGELTEEEEAGLRDVAAKHKEASEQEKKAAADLEELSRSKAEKEELKKQLDEAKAEVADERTFTKGIREKYKSSIRAKVVADKVQGLNILHALFAQKGIKFSVEDGEGSFAEKMREGMAKLGTSVLEEVDHNRQKFEAKMREILGDNAPKDMEQVWQDSRDRLSKHIQDSIEQVKKRDAAKGKPVVDEGDAFDLGERDIEAERDATTAALAEKAKEGLSKGQLRRYITALARGFIKEGITEIEPLTDALHAEVQKALPDITRTETRDAFSGFGEWKKLSTDPDEVLRQQLVSEAQTVSKIEHLQKQVESGSTEVGLPPKTGKERADQRPQKREREAKYKKLLKELLQSGKIKVTTDPAKQLKTTLDGIKTRLQNEIDDLDFALATRERRVNRDKTSTEYDAEAKVLKEKRDAKKAEYDKMFPKEPITDEQLLKRAEVVARKNLESWEKKLEDAKNGKFDAADKEQGPINQRVQHLRDMAKAARAELQHLRDLADPPISDAQKKLNAALIARERWEQILSGDLTTDKPKQQEALTDLEHDVHLEIDAMKRLVADLKKAQKPATDPEAAREAAKIRALEKATAEYERRAKAMDFTKAAGKVDRPDTYKMSVVRSAYEAAKAAYEAAKATTVEVKSDLEKTISARYAHALRRIADLAERRRTSNFSPRPKKPEAIATTPKEKEAALKLQKAIIAKKKLELKFNQDKEAYRLKHRTGLEKTLDGIAKWGRAFVLTGFHTIEKLTSAAAMITGLAPIEQAIGAVIAKALPKSITDNAPTRSQFSVHTEIKAVTETFRNLFKDFGDALTKGSTDLDFLYGKPDIAPHEFLDYIGNLHYALKTPAKRNEWVRHFEYDMKHEARLAAKRGETFDPLDPAIQLRSGIKAYKASMRSIFSEENVVTEGFRAGLRWLSQAKDGRGNARVSAQALNFLLNYTMPIVKIPTNIVARMFEYSLGGAIAGGKIMYAGLGNAIGERGKTGKWNLREDFRKGLEAMPPEAADSIIRNLARGSLGAALLTIGYFYPNAIGGYYTKDRKQEDGEPAYGTVGNIPKVLLHNPLLEQLQIGATVRKVADTLNPDGDPKGSLAGTKAALLGMLEQVPFVREAGLIKALQNDNAGAQMWADQTSGRIVPQGIKELARAMDKDAAGEPVKRNPSTQMERFKMNLPGLRKQVPVKEEEYHPMRAPSIRRKKRS